MDIRNNFGTLSGERGEMENQKVTKPLRWPNDCSQNRDRAAEAAVAGIKALDPILGDLPLSEKETIRRVAIAIGQFHQIARLLEEVGAQTRA